ncbi:hypothetical protein AAE478_010557 [Parahypoxylon ruwenzoriense]
MDQIKDTKWLESKPFALAVFLMLIDATMQMTYKAAGKHPSPPGLKSKSQMPKVPMMPTTIPTVGPAATLDSPGKG